MKGLTIVGVYEAPDGSKTVAILADGTGPGGGIRELPISEEIFQMWLTRSSIEESKKHPLREAAAEAGVSVGKNWVPVEL